MREKLIEEMIKEIYGPRKGVFEEIEGDPKKEYLTGVIVPRSYIEKKENPDSENIISGGEDFLADDDVNKEEFILFSSSEINAKMRIKSFGISFVVKEKNPTFKICVTWGRYLQKENKDKIWKRKPYFWINNIFMNEDSKKIIIYKENDGKILLYIKKVSRESENTIIIYLVNDLDINKCESKNLTEVSIFQPSIRINLLGKTLFTYNEKYENILSFLYRNKPILARGYMCSAIWREIDYIDYFKRDIFWPDGCYFKECEEFFICDVRSEFLPLYPNPAPIFEWSSEKGKPPECSAYKLSEMWEENEIEEYLSPLIVSYKKWIELTEKKSLNFPVKYREYISYIINNQKELLERIKLSIDLIKQDPDIRLSFCFANRTIWLQYKWKTKDKEFKWKPFQLAFIIMVIESLCNKNSKFRNYIDLLWIPTGGGKTEAYLSLIAFIMVLRRLKAKNNLNKTGGGTVAITRYTLRLLTIQQFRRTLRMITAAEYLRIFKTENGIGWRPKKSNIRGDLIYGSIRFSVGMWVGGAVSPNHLRKNKGAIDALLGKEAEGEPAQVIKCPICESYLSIPKSGLPKGEKLFLIIKSNLKLTELKEKISSFKNNYNYFDEISINENKEGYLTLGLISFNNMLKEKEIDEIGKILKKDLSIELISFRPSRPGYFKYGKEPGRKSEKPINFEIYCPNPNCELNKDVRFIEGIPLSLDETNREKFPDGYYNRKDYPFSNCRIPIPAFTVDEQIYHFCPTIIVSTADKIARLAFEPRAASIFGNVEKYNKYYGYYRNNLLPYETTKKASNESYSTKVQPFLPPELIIQDELHLLDGPLGSMFGLYENTVESLIKMNGIIPKYIASTATIKDAQIQVRTLFARKLFQFPPYGLDIDDNFFVKYPDWKEGWNERKPGRVYMGIYCPGMGPLTPPIRIWSRLLKTCYDNIRDKYIKYYWTIVEFFNSIRELGGGRALYREDIVERLKYISSGEIRNLDHNNVIELSSRINSTDIPLILTKLEAGDRSDFKNNPDAIFTTSMFGTGVDIPYLSLMIVNGQPKTTSQYIQATGRIGRNYGGLVITFLRAGRPRDLSHYEMFPAYHRRIYLEVEPSSVSPFSEGTLSRASGPVLVSFLRNMSNNSVEWFERDGKIILKSKANDDIQGFLKILSQRIRTILKKVDSIIDYFKSQINRWENIVKNLYNGEELDFVEYPFKEPKKNVVLGDPLHKNYINLKVVYHNAPQSLREIEETTGFEV
ncbi:MAG: DISARM system helicase DrmA [Promethearchaeota archaeon]